MQCTEHNLKDCFFCKASEVVDAIKFIDIAADKKPFGHLDDFIVDGYLKSARNHETDRYVSNITFGDECVIFYESLDEGCRDESWTKRTFTNRIKEIEDVYKNRVKRLAKEEENAKEYKRQQEVYQCKINARLV